MFQQQIQTTAMQLGEILGLFRQGKATAKSHLRNLIEIAASDGAVREPELSLLKQIAKRNKISEQELSKIQENPHSVSFSLPDDKTERFLQFYDLVNMMVIDRTVHEEEKKLCNVFAVKFGYPSARAGELVSAISDNIRNGQPAAETMKRLGWLMN
jgi:uncharacterized tellurite resistance protein B-like protein